jgi:hypothetical protein
MTKLSVSSYRLLLALTGMAISDRPLLADIVEKVENRTSEKILRKSTL